MQAWVCACAEGQGHIIYKRKDRSKEGPSWMSLNALGTGDRRPATRLCFSAHGDVRLAQNTQRLSTDCGSARFYVETGFLQHGTAPEVEI